MTKIEMNHKLEEKYKEAQSLIDGAYDIVEMWKTNSPNQIAWKKEWLRKAREHVAEGI